MATATKIAIVSVLEKQHEPLTTVELAVVLGMTRQTVATALRELASTGEIGLKRVGSANVAFTRCST